MRKQRAIASLLAVLLALFATNGVGSNVVGQPDHNMRQTHTVIGRPATLAAQTQRFNRALEGASKTRYPTTAELITPGELQFCRRTKRKQSSRASHRVSHDRRGGRRSRHGRTPTSPSDGQDDGLTSDSFIELPLAPVISPGPRTRPTSPPLEQANLTQAQRDHREWAFALLNSLTFVKGDVPIGNGLATLHLGEQFEFLGPIDAERVLTEVWHNPPGSAPLGMIVPVNASPFDPNSWGMVVRYTDTGHVLTANAATINFPALLTQAQDGMRSTDASRPDHPAQLVRWIAPPTYLPELRTIHWGSELRFPGADVITLNYRICLLSRRGVLELNFVGTPTQFTELQLHLAQMLTLADIASSNRYSDFDPKLDPIAAGGLVAVVTGEVPKPPAPAPQTHSLLGTTLLGRPWWLLLPFPVTALALGLWLLFKRKHGRSQREAAANT